MRIEEPSFCSSVFEVYICACVCRLYRCFCNAYYYINGMISVQSVICKKTTELRSRYQPPSDDDTRADRCGSCMVNECLYIRRCMLEEGRRVTFEIGQNRVRVQFTLSNIMQSIFDVRHNRTSTAHGIGEILSSLRWTVLWKLPTANVPELLFNKIVIGGYPKNWRLPLRFISCVTSHRCGYPRKKLHVKGLLHFRGHSKW